MIQRIIILLISPLISLCHDLSGLNPRKNYGFDGVSLTVLKICASVLTQCIVNPFLPWLSSSIFPSSWKCAYSETLLKKVPRYNYHEYRPIIFIFPVFLKLFQQFWTWSFLSTYQLSIICLNAVYSASRGFLLSSLIHDCTLFTTLVKLSLLVYTSNAFNRV